MASSPSAPARATATPPPSFEDIASCMMRYTGKLPGVCATTCTPLDLFVDGLAAPSSHGTPAVGAAITVLPYEYTGCDYALALAACFPRRGIDLTRLSWSQHPLPAQLYGNLVVFCEAATNLALPDAPTLSLQPSLLLPEARCAAHHVKVQHWLCSLARRFPPEEASVDPAALRAAQSWRQLGTPFLCLKRSREGEVDNTSDKTDDDDDVVLRNDPHHSCASILSTPCMSVNQLNTLRYALATTPPYTEVEPTDATKQAMSSAEGTSGVSGHLGLGEDKENKRTGIASLAPSADARAKPWLSYSKPWRLPAIEAANARRAKAEAAAAKQREAAKKADPTLNAFATGAHNIKEQLDASQKAIDELCEAMTAIRTEVMEDILAGHGSVDYPTVAAKLKKIGITPDV